MRLAQGDYAQAKRRFNSWARGDSVGYVRFGSIAAAREVAAVERILALCSWSRVRISPPRPRN